LHSPDSSNHPRQLAGAKFAPNPIAQARQCTAAEKNEYLAGKSTKNPFIFVSQRGTPFTTAGFARLLERAAEKAKLEIKVHPLMLRHACGFKLANDGSDPRSLIAFKFVRLHDATENAYGLRGRREAGACQVLVLETRANGNK
jgi:integrase